MKKPSEKEILREEIFDLMLKHVLNEHLEDIANEYPSPEELKGNYEYSENHENWIADFLSKNTKNENTRKFQWKSVKRKLVNVAAAITVLFAVFVMVAAAVGCTTSEISYFKLLC